MARRADHSREELAELALVAARDLVAKQGQPALTARNVARAIGYSPGTLYNLFEDFDDLVLHLKARTLDELGHMLSEAPSNGRPEHDLGQLLARYLQFVEQNRNLWNVLFEHKPEIRRELPDWYSDRVARLLGLIEEALAPLFREGARDARASAARVLWASLHGICSLSDSNRLQLITDRSVREMAEMLVECFVLGLRHRREIHDAAH